jgi:hypothetical protein
MKVMLLNALDGLSATDATFTLGEAISTVGDKLAAASLELRNAGNRARLPQAVFAQLDREQQDLMRQIDALLASLDAGTDRTAIGRELVSLERKVDAFVAKVAAAIRGETMSRPVKIVLWTLGILSAAALGTGVVVAVRRRTG